MVAGEQIHDGLLLVRPRLDALDVLNPAEEAFIDPSVSMLRSPSYQSGANAPNDP